MFLLALVALTLLAFLAGIALPGAAGLPSAFRVHLMLAVGVMSLITAAMQYFVPVLTRSSGVTGWPARLPWAMLTAGGVALAVFAGMLPYGLVGLAAGLAGGGVLAMLAWMWQRARHTLGKPHAGLAWYGAAMTCLGLGLTAVALMPGWPEHHSALRAFHLHINLYGFVGLTAVGTLQVLFPTATGRPDPGAAIRLARDLPWAMTGTLLLALGQGLRFAPAPMAAGAVHPAGWGADALVLAGLAGWGWVVGRLAWAWWSRDRDRLIVRDGAEPLLGAALAGFACALAGTWPDEAAVSPMTVFLPGFLLPLVMGAAGQLAPVWRRPGRRTEWHDLSRARLTRYNGWRALACVGTAGLALAGVPGAGLPALLALFWFVGTFVHWMARP